MLGRVIFLLCTLLVFRPQYVAACSSGTIAGIVLGTMFATIVVTVVIIALIGLIWFKRKDAGTKSSKGTKTTYNNSGFVGDVEMQRKKGQNGLAGSNAEIPVGYVECKEYESPNKDKEHLAYTKLESRSNGDPKARRNLFNEYSGTRKNKMQLDLPVHKTGSHGSLDGAMTPNDPEIISVSLQSQDIIGLGFNISGSMSEGIFVSQIHNRGPASESGQIKVGDRILSITISMTNMVYEDALTILSYASPYAVRLRLQRAMPLGHDKVSEDDTSNINHPVYRSQSLDDLSKISKDKWTGPRKTWSEIKRNHPAKDVVEGKLRKWTNTDDIVHEEVGLTKSTTGESKSSISNLSSDIAIDMIDPETEVTVHQFPSPSAEVVAVDIPSGDFSNLSDQDKEDHGMKRKSDDIPELSVNINDSGVIADAPPSKKLRDSISEDEMDSKVNINQDPVGLSEKDKLEMIEIDLNESNQDSIGLGNEKDVTVIEVSQTAQEIKDDFTLENEVEKPSEQKESKRESISSNSDSITKNEPKIEDNKLDNKLTVADINENKITVDLDKELMEGHLVKSQEELDNISTQVHVSESFVNRNSSDPSLVNKDVKHDDSVRAVLKDYFGDQPNLLEQFGFEEGKGIKGNVVNRVEVTTVTKDGKTTSTKMESSVEEVNKDTEVEGGSGSSSNTRRPKDYQYNTGTKGGMAYYLRFDENFYNDFGLFNHEFSTEKEQPNLVPVPIGDEVFTTSINENSGNKTDIKEKTEQNETSISMKSSENVHIVDSDPVKGTFTMEIKSSSDTNA